VEVEERSLVGVAVVVGIEVGVLVWVRELAETKELLLPGTVEREEPAVGEQSVANRRLV
jgi:hypothetical protein